MIRFIYLVLVFSSVSFLFSCSHILKPSKPKVGVIIGAGGARSLSAIGVLKVLKENNIPIDYLVGMGWGAWVASVYAKNESINEIQWNFHKLDKRGFFKSSFFKNSFNPKSVDKLDQELEETFSKDIKLKIPFSCPVLTQSGQQIWRTHGFLKQNVKYCISVPPFFKLDSLITGSILSVREAIRFLKSKKMEIIIWVNPLGDGALKGGDLFPKEFQQKESFFIWLEARNSFAKIENSVIKVTPQLEKFYLHDFSKVNDMVLKGEEETTRLVKFLQNAYPQLTL